MGCKVKLYIAVNHDISTINIVGLHTCLQSTHEPLEKKPLQHKLKENASTALAGTSKQIFDETCLQ